MKYYSRFSKVRQKHIKTISPTFEKKKKMLFCFLNNKKRSVFLLSKRWMFFLTLGHSKENKR